MKHNWHKYFNTLYWQMEITPVNTCRANSASHFTVTVLV